MGRLRVAIVGAGIVGCAIARELSRYENLDVVVIEREPDVGWGATKANTGIVHPGHEEDPDQHPLRARLCVEGNRLWREWARELDIPIKFPGELMLFFSEEERKRAQRFVELAKRNGVPEVRIVDGEELRVLEPAASPRAIGAVWAPTAGVVNPIQAAIAMIENAIVNGARLLVETEVKRVRVESGKVVGVETSRGFIEADIVINAAGINADEISASAGIDTFRIWPRKGQYVVFDRLAQPKPTRVLHTVPTPITKGVYAVTTTEGNLMIGPTAEDLPPDRKRDTSTTREGVEYVLREGSKLLERLPPRRLVIKTFAGLRPEPTTRDFVVEAYQKPWGFINAAGTRSPGLTAAPAIAKLVAKLIAEELGVELVEKRGWRRFRRGIERVRDAPWPKLVELVKRDPMYGWIICRDEMVSAAEVIEAVKRIQRIGARVTLDGVRFRTWLGMGRCQGSFCRVATAMLLSKVLGVKPFEITLRGKGSEYAVGDVKALWRERLGERRT